MEHLGQLLQPVWLRIPLFQTLSTVLLTAPLIQYSLPPNKNGGETYGSFQNRMVCFPSYPVQYPATIHDIIHIVRYARAHNLTVKALGARHSATDVICTEGIAMSMDQINFIQMNDDNTVTVGAGAQLQDVVEEIAKFDRTFEHIPTFGGITIAGALGCGSHGSSLLHPGSLSDQTVAMAIVDGLGKVRLITQEEDLKAFRVHLGLLGVVYQVTLKTIPQTKMRIYNYPTTEDILLNGKAVKMARESDFFQMWWFPSDKSVVVSKAHYVPMETPGYCHTNLIPNLEARFVRVTKNLLEAQQDKSDLRGLRVIQNFTKLSLYGYVAGKPPMFTQDENTLENPAVGYSNQLMANRCKPGMCGWEIVPEESALSMDIKELPRIVYTIKAILEESPAVFPLIGFFFRFSTPSTSLMAIENGRESVHLDWILSARDAPFEKSKLGLAAHQAIIQALVHEHDGRPHWGKNGGAYLTQSILQSRVPKLQPFTDYMRRFDPDGIFLNDFGRRMLGKSDLLTSDPREIHCALRDNCICKTDDDCGSSGADRCGVVHGYNVCQRTTPPTEEDSESDQHLQFVQPIHFLPVAPIHPQNFIVYPHIVPGKK